MSYLLDAHNDNTVRLSPSHPVGLRLAAWQDGRWQRLSLSLDGGTVLGTAGGIDVRLSLAPADAPGRWNYTLALAARCPTRVQLALVLPGTGDPFHLIPCCIFGDNNLAGAEPGHFPNLTREHADNVSCSPYWEFRADRASLPVSMLMAGGYLAAVSVNPYSECDPAASTRREGFIRNGVFAQLADGGEPHGCGVTLGYRNCPVSFVNKDDWGNPTEHLVTAAEAKGSVFLLPAADRRVAHQVMTTLYQAMRSVPDQPISRHDAITALTRAFCTINWQEGKRNFTNQNTQGDPGKKRLRPWRTLAEVGWTGGGVIGYPLLAAALYGDDADARQKALHALDWAARAFNPASGLLWDVCGEQEGTALNGWWSGYIVKDAHCAYTNASGVYYLLKSARLMQVHSQTPNAAWTTTAGKVLDTICALQLEDGNFGYTYSPERPEILDGDGFAGAWFVPALVLGYLETRREKYLAAARKGIAYYHKFVRELNCWGTPMDTWKSLEQEGNLGFMRGARLLHETTQEPIYLEMLENSAHYEYLWRYGFKARPEFPPLKGSHWNSCGGSVTSVSNPHIHPMGIFISNELKYLADVTGSQLHRQRWEDGLAWGVNIVSLYPGISGYGERGVLTERFCPSDGLTVETFPDGSPSSLWFSYNGWAAAAVLEGLVEAELITGKMGQGGK